MIKVRKRCVRAGPGAVKAGPGAVKRARVLPGVPCLGVPSLHYPAQVHPAVHTLGTPDADTVSGTARVCTGQGGLRTRSGRPTAGKPGPSGRLIYLGGE